MYINSCLLALFLYCSFLLQSCRCHSKIAVGNCKSVTASIQFADAKVVVAASSAGGFLTINGTEVLCAVINTATPDRHRQDCFVVSGGRCELGITKRVAGRRSRRLCGIASTAWTSAWRTKCCDSRCAVSTKSTESCSRCCSLSTLTCTLLTSLGTNSTRSSSVSRLRWLGRNGCRQNMLWNKIFAFGPTDQHTLKTFLRFLFWSRFYVF